MSPPALSCDSHLGLGSCGHFHGPSHILTAIFKHMKLRLDLCSLFAVRFDTSPLRTGSPHSRCVDELCCCSVCHWLVEQKDDAPYARTLFRPPAPSLRCMFVSS